MLLGKFFKPVLLRSKLTNYFKLPIHSGAYYSLFFARANSLSFVKFWIASGNLVSLFLERSRKVNFVRFLNDSGRSLNWLLSDSSFFNNLRFPKLSGRAYNLLCLMFKPSMLVKVQISSGRTVSWLFLRLSFFIPFNLETVSTEVITFLLSWSLSIFGKFSVINLIFVNLLSASYMFMMCSMPYFDPSIISILLSSMFSSINDKIYCSFL